MVHYGHRAPVVWLCGAAIHALTGWDGGSFSYAQDKPGAGGGAAVLAVEVGVVGLEPLAVKPAADHVLPAGFPAVPLEDFRPLLHHSAFQLVGEGFGLRLQLCDHGPDAHQVTGGAVQFGHAHYVTSFIFGGLSRWLGAVKGSLPSLCPLYPIQLFSCAPYCFYRLDRGLSLLTFRG